MSNEPMSDVFYDVGSRSTGIYIIDRISPHAPSNRVFQ